VDVYLSELWDWLQAGSDADRWRGSWLQWIWWCSGGAGIQALCESGGWRPDWLRGGYPAVCGSGAGLSPGTAWRAEILAEPEQWLCRCTGQGFGRPALLLLDGGMEKPSTV
jgi:hypothetical protein